MALHENGIQAGLSEREKLALNQPNIVDPLKPVGPSMSQRVGMALTGTLGQGMAQYGNAQTAYNREVAAERMAQQQRKNKVKDLIFQTLTENYQATDGTDRHKQDFSSGVERLFGRDSVEFESLFNTVPDNNPPDELQTLGGGPSNDKYFDEPVLGLKRPKGDIITLVNPRDPKDVIAMRKDDRGIAALLKKGYVPKDKNSRGRGEWTTLENVVVDGETVRVPWNSRLSTQENMSQAREYIKTNNVLVSPKTPKQQRSVASAKAAGKEEGKERQIAKLDYPKVESNADYLKKIVNKLLVHPAFKGMVGAPSIDKGLQFISGTEAAGFKALQDQLLGKQFSQAYETLKGGGQITEIEGEKATDALSRMKTSVSEKEYRAAAQEFLSEIDRLTKIAKQRASGKEVGLITGQTNAPEGAVNYLKENDSPELRKQFKEKYGYLP